MTGHDGFYVGFDLGTSGLKAVALDEAGLVVARASSGYPTRRPAAGAAEQSPEDWMAALVSAAGQLAARAAPDRWLAIGLSGMLPTLVTVGADSEPLGPAITWQDSRAEVHAERLSELIGGSELYQVTGQRVDGRYLLPMFLRLAEAEPSRAALTKSLLGAKDFLFERLTGLAATDPSTAAGFGCYQLATGRWDDRILAAVAHLAAASPARANPALTNPAGHNPAGPSPAGHSPAGHSPAGHRPQAWPLPSVPPVLAATATRPLRPSAAARLGCGQIPVCVGAADSVLGALGLGVRRPGQIAYVAGTSTVILAVTDVLQLDPLQRFLVTPLAEPGRWGLEMDLLATGSALRWLAALLGGGTHETDPTEADPTEADAAEAGTGGAGPTEADLIGLAARTDPADAPVILPYLSPGEQGTLWDPLLHGTIAGLTLGHGRRHLARGLVNGIVLEARRCLAVLDETGQFDAEIQVAGGSAAEPAFRADLANATGRRVSTPAGQDHDFSAVGAALLAARSAGRQLADPGARAGGRSDPVIHRPDPMQAARWDRLWARHEDARRAITPLYHATPASTGSTTTDGASRTRP